MISLLIWLIIIGLIFYVIWWGISQIPLPAPFAMIVRVVFVLIVVLVLLDVLGALPGIGVGRPLLR